MAGERLEQALKSYRQRYWKSTRKDKSLILDEFCELTHYHRKYAIALLNDVNDQPPPDKRKSRKFSYSKESIRILAGIWKAAGYPWSVRLKAMLPQWLPYAKNRYPRLTADIEQELLSISSRQIDRRLKNRKHQLKDHRYGRTKPGTLLKHQIPIKTDRWDVEEPGFVEIDLVSHSGENASGEFLYSLNITDIETGWVETRAILGKGQNGVLSALQDIRKALPFPVKGIDSDNGSEFINWELLRICQDENIQFTRGRPYHKNDNAHIEQKNWTHVRKIMGWVRYDTTEARDAMNDLYANELAWMMNLFQPSVKLLRKKRIGSRVHREYDVPRTPIERLVRVYRKKGKALPKPAQRLLDLSRSLDPFALSDAIDRKLTRIERLQKRPQKILEPDKKKSKIQGALQGTLNPPSEVTYDSFS